MRSLLAALAIAFVAFVAMPAAHAGSVPRSMPRTLRAPGGMERCIEEPISLAFDVVAQEAARFAAPSDLTSHRAPSDARARTSARDTRGQHAARRESPSVRRADVGARAPRAAVPCRAGARASVHSGSSALESQALADASHHDGCDARTGLHRGVLARTVASRPSRLSAQTTAPMSQRDVALGAHALTPWRPPIG